uniref:G-protein coupled receptors family 2 profile 1 domain-containing protein n=1 Tax=Serinus canaria TaxID=9135 RepID=A0A8C9NG43_SERCA
VRVSKIHRLVLVLTSGGSSDGSLSEVVQKWKEYQLQCQKYLYETPPIVAEGKFCNRTFDDYACWPDGLPGTYVNVSCPWYLPWANAVLHGQVYRFCTSEGTWLLKENSTLPWRNLSECEAMLFLTEIECTLSWSTESQCIT